MVKSENMNTLPYTQTKDKDLLVELLISPKYHLLRHSLLFLVSIIMAIANFYMEIFSRYNRLIEIVLMVVFLIPIYANIYILVPRLLFKNKLFVYLLSVIFFMFLTITLIVFLQLLANEEVQKTWEETDIREITLNFICSVISLGLTIAGTSSILLFQHWVIYDCQIRKLEEATMQSELEQLKNQINPHFLFNMLNNANVLTQENPEEAAKVLLKLNELLDYQLKDRYSDSVRLSDEILFLTDFLNLEKLRRDNFDFIISREGAVETVLLPPLLLIPFVENAVKHNNDNRNLSYVHLYFKAERGFLQFVCINSKPSYNKAEKRDGGLGLANIRRRLQLLYGEDHFLKIEENDITYTIDLQIKL